MIKYILRPVVALVLLCCWVSCSKETALPVKADFSYEVLDNDYSVPVRVTITNSSIGAEYYHWTFEGAVPGTYDQADPGTVLYETPGTYKITLEASNRDGGKDVKQVILKIDSTISIHYSVAFVQDSFPAATVHIVNTTDGPDTYNWTFEGGQPASSEQKNPGDVLFPEPGTHLISLKVTNGRETYQKDTTIIVAPHLEAAFEYEPDIANEGWEAPVTLHMHNHSISATQYSWQYAGASNGMASQQAEPDIVYTQPGTYTIAMTASNGKETKLVQQQITVLPNSNLRVLNDMKFGINTAQHTIGCYFSTQNRKVYPRDSLNTMAGLIDIAFYGLNNSFTYNRFVAADQTALVGLNAVPGATHTLFINSLELCGCGISFTEAVFDNMTNDAVLQGLNFTENAAGLQPFTDGTLPRIVLFKTASGIKGAIKIKQFVDNGVQSYIVADMKYLKQP